MSDIPPAAHAVEDSDLAALTDELTRLAREDDEASEEASPTALDELLGADDRPTDAPPPPSLDELARIATEPPSATDAATLQELSEALGIDADGSDADGPEGVPAVEPLDEPEAAEPAPAPPLFADHPAAAPSEQEHDEPVPWVGHTDQLDGPHAPQPTPPPRDTTREPPLQDEHAWSVHRADDGSPAPGAADAPATEHVDPPPTEAHRAAQEAAEDGPATRVHAERIDSRPGPIQLTPSEAVALASEGPRALRRARREP